MNLRIDLNDYVDQREAALVGRDEGKARLIRVEQKVGKLREAEEKHQEIHIIIPPRIITINRSFFLGFFEERILALGGDKFRSKYKFITSDTVLLEKIDQNIDSALLSASQNEILGV